MRGLGLPARRLAGIAKARGIIVGIRLVYQDSPAKVRVNKLV